MRHTTDQSVPLLRRFAPLTEKQVSLIIKQMKSKTCELDDIPTKILKKILPTVCPLITRIVNTSLTTGGFSTKWKTAVVRPLIKKIGLELIKQISGLLVTWHSSPKLWKGPCSYN